MFSLKPEFLHLVLSLALWKMVKTLEVVSMDSFKQGNFVKLGEGSVLQKNESLLSRKLASSKGECCFLCVKDPPCLSVNVIPQSSSSFLCEFFNWTATNVSAFLVSRGNSFHFALKNVCLNGGSCLRQEAGICHCACPDGYYGSFCEGPFKDCAALQTAGFTSSGVYHVDPDGKGFIQVYCDMVSEGGGWTVISNRLDGSVSFHRNWAEYKAGFGDIKNGEFWLGNDNIHRLTAARPRTQLYIPLVDTNGAKFYAKYSTFAVANESDLYRLTVSGYFAGNAGNAMDHSNSFWTSNGMAFSTHDRDNDNSPNNCAFGRKSGWWMNYCEMACLTKYPVGWSTLDPVTMSKGSMKIKPYNK